MITTEEMERLRVPLSALPGIDPAGMRGIPELGFTKSRFDNAFIIRWDLKPPKKVKVYDPSGWYSGDFDASQVMIDLADASTRDRVARWLAIRFDIAAKCTAPKWATPHPTSTLKRWLLDFGRVCFSGEERAYEDRADKWVTVPTLATLDPTDDRCLPDGSRYVDALALALVATHLGSTP